MTPDEYVARMNANFDAGRLAALHEVREMVRGVECNPLHYRFKVSIVDRIDAMIKREEEK